MPTRDEWISDLETHTEWKCADGARELSKDYATQSLKCGRTYFSDNVDYKIKNIIRDNIRHYIMINGLIQEEYKHWE